MPSSLRIVPYREIAHEVAARLAGSREGRNALDPWDEEVIVPSRGVAEAIASALLERLPRGLAGLQLRSIDALASTLVIARVANDAERRLAMRVAVRAVDHPMMEGRGVAAMLERSYRDVRDSGLTLQAFAKRMASTRALRNPLRTAAIVQAWTEYERLIAQLGAIDPADHLARAAQRITPAIKPQLVAGFYDMTGAQLGIVEALREAGRLAGIWIPTAEPFAHPLIETLGRQAPPPVAPVPDTRGRVSSMQHETRLDEIRDVCASVEELLRDGVPAREIGIVARSLEPYDVHLLNRFLPTTLGEELPLIAHRIGRGATTLLRLRERGFPRGEVLELVRDGLRVRTQLDVDAADYATRRARLAGGMSEELAPIRGRSPILGAYVALVAELEELTASIDVELLARLGSLFRIDTDLDLAAAEKLDTIARLFRETQTWTRGLDAAAVLDAIENESLPVSSVALPVSVWAGDVMRFRGRSFTHLFVLRMQDDVFPQRRNEDPLLPDSDRRSLGLREIGDGREEEQLLFSLLRQEAEHVHFNFAASDGFGKILRQSRYIRSLPMEDRRPRLSNHAPSPLPPTRRLQLIARAGTRSPFDGYLATAPEISLVSPTQLEDFGECPQKFLLKHILGVEDIDHPERELQIHHRDKGTIDHRILERFYRGKPSFESEAAMYERLDAIVDAQFDALEAEVPPFNVTVRGIERRATKRILREFVAADLLDLDAQNLVPRFFEYKFGTKHRDASDHPEPFVMEAGGVKVRVEGTIDRIDADHQRYRIVDYKSGKALRHVNLADKIDRGVRLQLALYAMAVASFFDADPHNVSGTIKPLVAGENKLTKFAFALHEKRDGLLETLDIFVRSILHGLFPAFPDDDLGTCKYCPVNHSCRTKHDPDERYALQQLRDPRTLLGGGR